MSKQEDKVAPTANAEDKSDASSDSGDSTNDAAKGPLDRLAQLRREKRLKMNRESARKRRRRKKDLLEKLEQQVEALTAQNQRFMMMSDSLSARVKNLESELAMARSTIAVLNNQGRSFQAAGQTGAFVPAPHQMASQPTMVDLLRTQQQQQQRSMVDMSGNSAGVTINSDALLRHSLSLGTPTQTVAVQGSNAGNPGFPAFLGDQSRGLNQPVVTNTVSPLLYRFAQS